MSTKVVELSKHESRQSDAWERNREEQDATWSVSCATYRYLQEVCILYIHSVVLHEGQDTVKIWLRTAMDASMAVRAAKFAVFVASGTGTVLACDAD